MTQQSVQSEIIAAIARRGFKVHLDLPGEGFLLMDAAGQITEPSEADDESVSELCVILEVLTTDTVDCDGSPDEVAARLLTRGDSVAALQMDWDVNVESLALILRGEECHI
jgi:hypothetical protein